MREIFPEQNRIQSLDVLRGFALLGILLMNIQSFSMPGAAYLNPYAYGDMQGANYWVWVVSHTFADQKFMGLFSMLFGIGVLIFSQSIEAKGLPSAKFHYRRNAWLLLFGIIHGYFFWYGDILFSYALCAFWVFLLRNKSTVTLFTLGLCLIGISSLISVMTGFAIPHIPDTEITGMSAHWQPTGAQIEKELLGYTSGWLSALEYRAEETAFMQSYVFLTTFVWRAGGMMLIGMALFKSGFFSGKFSIRWYAALSIICLVIGFTLIASGLVNNHEANFSLEYSMFLGNQFNYWGSVFVAIAYASMTMLGIKKQWLPGLQKRLAAVGKTAFSNYILQTLICTTLFYSFGFLGSFSRLEQLFLVLLIWALQLVLSPMWLNRFKFGPLEWFWRCLTYWEKQPFRRGPH